MIVNVEFKSKCEIGDRVHYGKQGFPAGAVGKIIKVRFVSASHEFEYLVEVEDDDTREWKLENSFTRLLNTRDAFVKLMGAVNNDYEEEQQTKALTALHTIQEICNKCECSYCPFGGQNNYTCLINNKLPMNWKIQSGKKKLLR